MKLKLAVFLMVLGMISPGLLPAAEILTEEDFDKKVVVEEDFIKLADNFIVLFDASNSMKRQYKKGAPWYTWFGGQEPEAHGGFIDFQDNPYEDFVDEYLTDELD